MDNGSNDLNVVHSESMDMINASTIRVNPYLLSENFRNLSQNPLSLIKKTSLRTLDPLQTGWELPSAEYSQFEDPTLEFIDDYKNMLEDHGVDSNDVCRIAAVYDNLR